MRSPVGRRNYFQPLWFPVFISPPLIQAPKIVPTDKISSKEHPKEEEEEECLRQKDKMKEGLQALLTKNGSSLASFLFLVNHFVVLQAAGFEPGRAGQGV